MTERASDYRYAGRMAAQDRRSREARRAIEAVEDAYMAARDAYHTAQDDGTDETEPYAAYQAATKALYEADPTNSLLM